MTTFERDELIRKVDANPFDYCSFEKLLNVLQELNDAESLLELRKYRIIFSERFTPDTTFWQSWIADSIVNNNEVEDVLAKALLRCPNKNIVADFLDYKQRQYEEEQLDENRMREAYEKAISIIGLDILDSGNFWKSYRDFEIDEYEDLVETQSDSNKLQEAKIRIIKLFRRQLSTPLMDNELILQEFDTCLADICIASDEQLIDPTSLQINYEKALEDRETRLVFEQHLISENYQKSNNEDKLNSWKSYLQLELEENNIQRILRLYERALLELYNSKQLWREYTQFVANTLKDWNLTEIITSRALIICYKESFIWKLKLISMEMNQRSEEEISTTVQIALQSGLESADDYLTILLHHCQYHRRKLSTILNKIELESNKSNNNNNINNHIFEIIKNIYSLRTSFSDAEQFLNSYYPTWIAGKLAIVKYQSQVEDILIRNAISKLGEDTAGPGLQLEVDVSSIWENLVKSNGKYLTVWLPYITWVKQHESRENCRKLYKRALANITDYLPDICESWLEFEREVGSLQDLLDAESKVNPKLKLIEEKKRGDAEKEKEKEKEKETLKSAHKRNKKITSLSDILPAATTTTSITNNNIQPTITTTNAVSANKYITTTSTTTTSTPATTTTTTLSISSDVRIRSNSLTVDASIANNTIVIPQTRRITVSSSSNSSSSSSKKRYREELLSSVTSPHGYDGMLSPTSDILLSTVDSKDAISSSPMDISSSSNSNSSIGDREINGPHRKKEKRVTFVNPLTEVIPSVDVVVAENGNDHDDSQPSYEGVKVEVLESNDNTKPKLVTSSTMIVEGAPTVNKLLDTTTTHPTSLPTSHTVFVKNLSFESTENEIKDFFTIPLSPAITTTSATREPSLPMETTTVEDEPGAASEGLMITPVFVSLTKSQSGKSRGMAQVHFIDEEGVREALKLNGKSLRGRVLVVERFGSTSDEGSSTGTGKVLDPCTLYVEGFGKSIVENKVLTDIFSDCGEIVASKISKDTRTGKGKGHALLQYAESKSLQDALLRHWKVKGRSVTVSQSWYPILKKSTSDTTKTKLASSQLTNKSQISFKPRKLVLKDTAAAAATPHSPLLPTSTTSTIQSTKNQSDLPDATATTNANTNERSLDEKITLISASDITSNLSGSSGAIATDNTNSNDSNNSTSQPVKTNADFRNFYK